MPTASKVMMGFGAVLVACAAVGWVAGDGALRAALAMGLATIAAGASAAQGRTSLRRAGNFLGLFLPALAFALFGWRALDYWNPPGDAPPRPFPATILTLMSLAGLVTVLVLMKLRAGDAVAERGYSVLPMSSQQQPEPAPESQPVDKV